VFAFTIYKSQGLILNQAVLNISRKEHTIGLTYISISWAKKLLGLIFKQGFNKELFNPIASVNKQAQ
jgi:ATP-dependent exoDNAse (exonuclease V) alpha subunit